MREHDPERMAADLRVRAAAPELLAVLQKLFEIGTVYPGAIESNGPFGEFDEWAATARAAIAKATGEAS